MASNFPIQYYTGTELGPMNLYFVPDATNGAAIVQGSLVFQAADGEIELCGADPAAILGVAKGAFADKFLWADLTNVGRLPVSVLSPAVRIGLCVGAGTLAASHAADPSVAYGVQKLSNGNWGVNLSDVTGGVFQILQADVTNQIAWGTFLAAALQRDAVAS